MQEPSDIGLGHAPDHHHSSLSDILEEDSSDVCMSNNSVENVELYNVHYMILCMTMYFWDCDTDSIHYFVILFLVFGFWFQYSSFNEVAFKLQICQFVIYTMVWV